jgi:uncharacterized protein CbrC (UPF0167 family)
MIGFLYRLFFGNFSSCKHSWEIIQEEKIKRSNDKARIGTVYIQKCKHCGKLNRFDVTLG